MDVKDSYLHGTIGVVKSISVNADKLTYTLADINQTATTVTLPVATQSANGLLSSADKIKLDKSTGINQSIPYIVGPDTDTTAGTWTGTYSGITEYNDGLTIIYVPKVAGASTTTLNINNIGSKVCYYSGSSKLTTHYPAGTPILLTYSGGYWKRADYYYDSLQLRVYRQTTGYDADYPILVSRTLASSIGTSGSDNSSSNIYGLIGNDTTKTPTINPLTGEIKAPKFTGTFNGTANSVANSLILKIKSGTTEGTSLYTYNGAANKTLDIKQGDNVTLTAAEGELTIAASDSKVTQTNETANNKYRLLFSNSQNDNTETNGVKKSTNLLCKPGIGEIIATTFRGSFISGENRTSKTASLPNVSFGYFQLNGTDADANNKRYAGDSTGFPVNNNVNSILWLGSHSNSTDTTQIGYGDQLGFSGYGIYHRRITNGSFPTSENGESWKKLAYTSDIPTKVSQLTNDTNFITGGYIGTTSIQSTSKAQALTGINTITPSATNTYNLGTRSVYWNNTFTNHLYIGGDAINTTARISSDTTTNMVFYVSAQAALVINSSEKSIRPGLSYNDTYTLGTNSSYFKNLYTNKIEKVNTPNDIILANNTTVTPHLIFQRNTSSDSYNDYHIWGEADGIKFGLSTTDSTNITWLATLGGVNTGLSANKFVIPDGTSSQVLKADGSVEDLSRIERNIFTANTDGWYKIGTLPTTNYTFGLFTITKGYSNYPSESYLIAIGSGRSATGTNSYNSEFSINLLLGQYPVKQYIQKIRLSKIDNSKTNIEVYITFNNGSTERFQITNMNSNIILQTPELVTETPETYKEMTLVKGIKTSDKFYGDLVGNSDTASKLITPKTIWGQSFDGTSDIKGCLHITEDTIGNYTQGIRINQISDYSMSSIWLATTTSSGYNRGMWGISATNTGNFRIRGGGVTEPLELMCITQNGNVGIGVPQPTEKLEVSGNIKATTLKGNLDWSYIQNKPTSLPANGGDADTVDGKHASDFLLLTGGTMTGWLRFNSEKGISQINGRYKEGSGGWANVTVGSYGPNSELIYNLGAYGWGKTIAYVYLGLNDYYGVNFRIYSNKITYGENTILHAGNYTDYINTTNFPGLNKTGTVTSVGLSVPTGFSVSPSSITTSGTLAISFASGYSLPTTAKQTNWDTVYNWYTGVTADDTDALVNKWGEIVDFLDAVAEGTDITDEFVTRKTDQKITGLKTFIGPLAVQSPTYKKYTKLYSIDENSNCRTIIQGGDFTHSLMLYDNFTSSGLNYATLSGGYTNDALLTLRSYTCDTTNNTAAIKAVTVISTGASAFADQVTARKFITRNGTSAQFVKGNGDLDSTTYATMTQLEDLENQLAALSAGIKVTASLSVSTIYKNTATSVKITGTTKDNAGNITASEIVIKEDSTILATANNVATTSHTKSVTTTSSSIVFTVTAIAQGLPLSTTVTLYARYPVMYGMGTSAENVYTNGSKASARTSAVSTSTYNATASANNVRFYLLVPSDVTRPTSFTMGGAPVDMVIPTATTTIGGIAYYVFYTNAIYNSGAAVQIKAN